MIPGFPNAMPVEGFIGGLLIGLAAAIMLLGLGRIAGVSGLAARASGIADTSARRGSGCTSGHGVCGMSRLSPRSLVATALFMASGFVTVALLRLGGFL